MFDLKRHLIREINKSGFDKFRVTINHELVTGNINFELEGIYYEGGVFNYESIESFNNEFIFSQILNYLFDNDLFSYMKVVNY